MSNLLPDRNEDALTSIMSDFFPHQKREGTVPGAWAWSYPTWERRKDVMVMNDVHFYCNYKVHTRNTWDCGAELVHTWTGELCHLEALSSLRILWQWDRFATGIKVASMFGMILPLTCLRTWSLLPNSSHWSWGFASKYYIERLSCKVLDAFQGLNTVHF